MLPRLHFCGLSDIGLNRPTNQDVWAARPEIGFFALADGMGGRRAGDVAAKEALQILCETVGKLAEKSHDFQDKVNLTYELRHAIEQANRWVYKMGCEKEPLLGMGTTLCCLLWTQDMVYYAHVGDSRIYRFRNGKLDQLTRDHSLLAKWLSKKRFDHPSPPKNIITRAIGMPKPANPEISFSAHQSGDLFLLCSDGLTDVVQKEVLQKILRNAPSMERSAQRMIDSAKKMGSGDNITVLMISEISEEVFEFAPEQSVKNA
jgi:PPM family protein phosphatase